MRKWRRTGVALGVAACPWLAQGQQTAPVGQAGGAVTAAAAPIVVAPVSREPLALETTAAAEKLHILVGQSMMLRGSSPMRRIYVGNPAVLQTYTAGPQETVLTAKTPGMSSLVIWDDQGKSCLYTVSSDLDPASLQLSLANAYPLAPVRVSVDGERITLSGNVATQEISDGLVKIAANFSKDLVNSLRLVPVHPKQVQLKLRIAEVDRSRLEQFGINLTRAGNNVFGASTGQFSGSTNISTTAIAGSNTVNYSISDPLTLFFSNLSSGYGVSIQDLQAKNILQILAEPNLTTLSGQPARFLSGGEFPVPIAQSGAAGSAPVITIQFKPFGVKVDFTPTVNPDGSIRLKIAPEVSTLDYSNEVTVSGFAIPSLSTRRAESEVEIKDGQSFALTGLLDRRTQDQMDQIPGIGSIPILGQFFRSKNINHSQTELIMVVTATVVDPLGESKPVEEPRFPVPFLNVPNFERKGIEPAVKVEGER